MSDSTLAAPVRATGKKSSAPASPPKAVKKPTLPPVSPMPEGDRLALEAAEALQNLVLTAIYGERNEPRELHNIHLSEVDHLLWRLLEPAHHERDVADPQEGDIAHHLKLISSELEGAVDVLQHGIPGFATDLYLQTLALVQFAFEFADCLCEAYTGLPGTLEELRALITQEGAYAGVKRYREPPRPPMRRVEPEQADYAPEMTDDTEFELTLLLDRVDSVTSLLVQMFGTGIDTDSLKLDGLNGALSNVRGCLSESLGLLDGISHIPEDLKTGLFEAHGLIETLSTFALASNGGWHMNDHIYSAYFDAASQCVDRAKDGLKLITKGAA